MILLAIAVIPFAIKSNKDVKRANASIYEGNNMRTETIKVYDINEMKEKFPKAYKSIIERFIDFNVDYEWWDYAYEGWNEDLEKYGMSLNSKETTFNIGYPGSYLDLKVDVDDPDKLLAYIKDNYPPDYKEAMGMVRKYLEEDEAVADDEAVLEVLHDELLDFSGNDVNDISELNETILNHIINELSADFLKGLEEQYEYLISDEAIEESLEANNFEFIEDGRTW